jgi:hypothetical protein
MTDPCTPVLWAETRVRLRGVPVTIPALLRELTPEEARTVIEAGQHVFSTRPEGHRACHRSEHARTGCSLLMLILTRLGYTYTTGGTP